MICRNQKCTQTLETLLKMEINEAEKTLLLLDAEVKKAQAKAQSEWQLRREMQEKIRVTKENIMVLSMSLNKQDKYNDELFTKMELTRLNLDDEYKVRRSESQAHENIVREYDDTYRDYRARYEQFPLAKARKIAEMKLKKLEVEQMVVEYKIEELERLSRQKDEIAWQRLRGKIVDFASDMLNDAALDRKRQELIRSIEDREKEVKAAEEEMAVQKQIQEEKKRIRELEMLKMPPPKINLPLYMRSCYRSCSREPWKLNSEDSLDSISVNTLLEEMCISEDSLKPCRRSPSPNSADKNAGEEAIDAGSPCSERGQEMEQEDADAGPEAIDMADEEESRQEYPAAHPSPLLVPRDKQTSELEEDVPAKKRIRMMTDESPAWSSPLGTLKATRPAARRSQFVDASQAPRITRIETVRCNVSVCRDRNEHDTSTATRHDYSDKPRDSFCSGKKGTPLDKDPGSDRSPVARISKMDPPCRPTSLIAKIDQANPASMFSPGYSESSSIFGLDHGFDNLKADQISLYGGSVRSFNVHDSEISMAEARPATNFKEDQPLARPKELSQLSFSNILKTTNKSGPNKLF
ncbi:uncharacterized protein LOC117229800 isoform X2 [Megalopta genalis]|uniref:uncharacterized protein LOC117229800 isoform X2 n=1 Tax=Megalopta genalis TaxID=115081 RepID=UPI003FD1FA57